MASLKTRSNSAADQNLPGGKYSPDAEEERDMKYGRNFKILLILGNGRILAAIVFIVIGALLVHCFWVTPSSEGLCGL